MAWAAGDPAGAAQTARVTAEVLPLPHPATAHHGRRTATRIAVGVLAAAALVLGGLALRTAATSDEDSITTVAQLDGALGITAAGSRELDHVPDAVLQAALDREAGDTTSIRTSGVPVGSTQRFGVVFTATDRAAAERLTTLLSRATRFTVALTAPSSTDPHWTVGAITPKATLTIPLAHQLTERMSEAAARAAGTTFDGWRVVGR
jgi:hypothetical protein